MRQSYDDILNRIEESPIWWDYYGVPRFEEPSEKMAHFVKRIRCQNCWKEFRVGLVDDVYYALYGELIHAWSGDPCPVNPDERHIKVESGSMMSIGKGCLFEPKPLPENWHYGDPPYHHCVGDTMSSIPEYEWEEYERDYARDIR